GRAKPDALETLSQGSWSVPAPGSAGVQRRAGCAPSFNTGAENSNVNRCGSHCCCRGRLLNAGPVVVCPALLTQDRPRTRKGGKVSKAYTARCSPPGSRPWVETMPGSTHTAADVSWGNSSIGRMSQPRPLCFGVSFALIATRFFTGACTCT